METLFIEKIGERHNDKEDNYSRSRFPDISSHPEKFLYPDDFALYLVLGYV